MRIGGIYKFSKLIMKIIYFLLLLNLNFFLISISKRDGAMNLLLFFLKLSERVISQCSFSLQQILCLLCLDSCYLHARLGPSRNFLLCRRLPFTSRKHFFRVLSLRLNLVRLSYSRVGLCWFDFKLHTLKNILFEVVGTYIFSNFTYLSDEESVGIFSLSIPTLPMLCAEQCALQYFVLKSAILSEECELASESEYLSFPILDENFKNQ